MDGFLQIPQELVIGTIAVLDSLPDVIRAMLAGLLLVVFLKFFEGRISRNEVQFGQSFRKTALVALILIPLLVWLFPASRMVVFVEELPVRTGSLNWPTRTLLGIWGAGFFFSLIALIHSHRQTRREIEALPAMEDEKLNARLAHWQRRLGMHRFGAQPSALTPILVRYPGDRPRLFIHHSRIGLPSAATHWPGSTRDILIIQNLCHLKRHHGRWHVIAQAVVCVYWPVTWVQSVHRHLLQDFRRAADELTESCYQDKLGYGRALRQIEQRLTPPARRVNTPINDPETPSKKSLALAFQSWWRNYLRSLSQIFPPRAEPEWELESLLAERSSEDKLLWTDPYDKVVLFIGQAAFLAFLLTGVTLKERPPDIEYKYSMPFELLWKEYFHRNQELQDKVEGAD